MLMNILFLSFVFILGLISTFFGFPRKRILAWFDSLTVNSPTHHATMVASKSSRIASDEADHNKVVKKRSSDEDKAELRRVFATFDKNNDGYITKQELRESLKNIGISVGEHDISDMVARVDSNGDGLIDFDEFHELFQTTVMKKDGANNEDHEDKEKDLKEAFDVFDGDGDGLITVEELGLVLSSLGFKEGKTLESCKEMIKKVDLDGDGMVNFEEFKRMMKAGGKLVHVS